MVDTTRKSRLSPSLMCVFRAAHQAKDALKRPNWRQSEARGPLEAISRTAQRAPITESVLRHEVMRDLEALMNCVSIDSTMDLADFPAAKRSILNFGFPDLARQTIDDLEATGLEAEIKNVLCTYEPRLAAASLRIARDRRVDPIELRIRYIVHADLLCEPLNVPMEFVADVEVTTGKIHMFRL